MAYRLQQSNWFYTWAFHGNSEHWWRLCITFLCVAIPGFAERFSLTVYLTASYIADSLGRRAGVTIGLLVLFVGTIIQVVPSVNSNMFLAGRFLVGLGSVHIP